MKRYSNDEKKTEENINVIQELGINIINASGKFPTNPTEQKYNFLKM